MMNQSPPPPQYPVIPLDRGQPYAEMGLIALEPSTLEHAAELDVFELLAEFNQYDNDGPPEWRTLDGALLLYERLCADPAFEGIGRPDLFAACIDTAMIWERG